MTKVTFYILASGGTGRRHTTACKVSEKAYNQALSVYIATKDGSQSESIDDLLWTFRDGSFIPHDRIEQCGEQGESIAPILIGSSEPPASLSGLLVNLGDDIPSWFSRFDRVIEIIDSTDEVKASGRERFRWYRDRGYEIETHNL